MEQPRSHDILQSAVPRDRIDSTMADYLHLHEGSVDDRKSQYTTMINSYYDLVTDFYEYGWGQSFHFAPRFRGESFAASLARHEHYLALRLGLRPDMRVLDVGCGVGGPMRAIARFSGAHVTGVNNNDYQIGRGREHNRRAGLADRCEFLKADFMHLPVPDGTFDAAFAVEATCHAPDKVALFREIFRVLKPGGSFAGYEWCMTDRFDPQNPTHQAIKKGIEEGDALPDIWPTHHVVDALRQAGFQIEGSRDVADDADRETPWYEPLSAGWTLSGFKHTRAGRWVTSQLVRTLEQVGIAPKGAANVNDFLRRAATALVQGGETGIFTPMFFFHARKPQ